MSFRNFAKILFLVAASFTLASAQIIQATCDELSDAYDTLSALDGGDGFQISSINLSSYYIPSYVINSCINLSPPSQLLVQVDSSVENNRKFNLKKTKRERQVSLSPSFLEVRQTVVQSDVTDALVFDTVFISNNGAVDGNVYSATANYCNTVLTTYFGSQYFPAQGSNDNGVDRANYLAAALDWYENYVYDALNCTF